ncbi:hypothetical protein KY328_04800 [Candidatus Woesearchaeota archaeon]|nr:hypothetical protein [Candidatus Woesearchaeota archaeon]MBW3022217.1 hypothetical protein [Candidatus Woesearchaeota archaeon]
MYENMIIPFTASYTLSAALIALLAWTLVWKGWALWVAARKSAKIWFIVMLVLSTAGILPILYIFVFSKMGPKRVAKNVRVIKRAPAKRKTKKRRK